MNNNSSSNYVELALKKLNCNQSQLAEKLNVSTTQISKWKNHNDHMSVDFYEKFRELCEIGDTISPGFVLAVDSLENAMKWEKCFKYLANQSNENSETGYNCDPLCDFDEFRILDCTLEALNKLGMTLPKEFPIELDIDHDIEDILDEDGENYDLKYEKFNNNIYIKTTSAIYDSFISVRAFYDVYMYPIMTFTDSMEEMYLDQIFEIEDDLFKLAVSKVELETEVTSDFNQFKYKISKRFLNFINDLKKKAFQEKIPLQVELMDLLDLDYEEISEVVEYNALGFNNRDIHPDIYINELLVGMRTIHQILPEILKKLDIDFKLDPKELTTGR